MERCMKDSEDFKDHDLSNLEFKKFDSISFY